MITYTINEYGLRQKDMDYMTRLFTSIPEVEQVILYGSRANGSFERGSDIDLAVTGAQITNKHIAHIHAMLENESPTLLWFDVLHYDSIKDSQLKQQIADSGKLIYSRSR